MMAREAKTWIVRILVIAFAVRALIPVGYMPDLGALSRGVLKVVICTGSGNHSAALDAADQPQPKNNTSHASEPCAFAGLVQIAQFTPTVEPARPVYTEPSAIVPTVAVVLPPARAGPTRTSRGPPQVS